MTKRNIAELQELMDRAKVITGESTIGKARTALRTPKDIVVPSTYAALVKEYRDLLAENETHKALAADAIDSKCYDHRTGLLTLEGFKRLLKERLNNTEFLVDPDNCRILYLDLDKFKSVNDTYGHVIGDKVLEFVAATLKSHFRRDGESIFEEDDEKEQKDPLRSTDLIGRYGGDEFVVFMGNCSDEIVKERIKAVEQTLHQGIYCEKNDTTIKVSVSTGYMKYDINQSIEQNISIVDELQAKVKKNKRRRHKVINVKSIKDTFKRAINMILCKSKGSDIDET